MRGEKMNVTISYNVWCMVSQYPAGCYAL